MSVLVVRLNPAEAEACSDWLFQLGATAVEDRTEDPDPTLVAGFDSDDAALAARSLLEERWPCRLEDTGDEAEWRDRWLQYVEPIEVAGFVVAAPWNDLSAVDPAAPTISIDPGRAFGSGHHPTTRLALGALRDTLEPGDRVLDVGCGTGILSIAAAKLGASRVLGLDLDHDIVAVAEANVEANGVAGRVRLGADSFDTLDDPFDVVVANIVIGDLEPLLPGLVRLADRALVVSGFLVDQQDRIATQIPAGRIEAGQLEGWACVGAWF